MSKTYFIKCGATSENVFSLKEYEVLVFGSNLQGLLEVYMRHNANYLYCESSLLHDGRHLRQGLHNDNIIYWAR